MDAVLNSPLITPERAAELLGITVGTLNVWRCTRRYVIPFVKVGRSVRYRLADIEKWAASRTVGGAR